MKRLVIRAMQEDTEAFLELMQYHTQSMYKVARGFLRNEEDVADALQDTILTCFEKLKTLKEPKYFKTWMIRILINECKNILKENNRQCLLEEFPDVADTHSQTEQLEFAELLNALDEKYRVILILYYVEGFKIPEISQLLEMKESTVKTRLARGRKSLEYEYEYQPREVKGEKAYAQKLY